MWLVAERGCQFESLLYVSAGQADGELVVNERLFILVAW